MRALDLILDDSTGTYHLDKFWTLHELVGQRPSHDTVIQIFKELEVFFCQGSKAINLRCVFLNKMWYNIILDFLLLNGVSSSPRSTLTLVYTMIKKGMKVISKTQGGQLLKIFAFYGTGEHSFMFLSVIIISQTFKSIIVDDPWFLWSLCCGFRFRFQSWTIRWACSCNFIQSSWLRFQWF